MLFSESPSIIKPCTVKIIDADNEADLSKMLMLCAKKEGWLYSTEDIKTFLSPPFIAYGLYDSQNNIISSILMIKYSLDNNRVVYSPGAFIMEPQLRSQGIGKQLWEEIMGPVVRENPNDIIVLNATLRPIPYYKTYGFSELNIITFTMKKQCVSLHTDSKISEITPITEEQISSIFEYEQEKFGMNAPQRRQFLTAWLKRASFVDFCYEKNGKLAGYVVVTKNQDDGTSYRISPMYANSEETAEKLIKKLLSNFSDKNCQLSLNLMQTSRFKALLERYEFSVVPKSETFFMTNNKPINLEHTGIKNVVAISLYETPHELTWINK